MGWGLNDSVDIQRVVICLLTRIDFQEEDVQPCIVDSFRDLLDCTVLYLKQKGYQNIVPLAMRYIPQDSLVD